MLEHRGRLGCLQSGAKILSPRFSIVPTLEFNVLDAMALTLEGRYQVSTRINLAGHLEQVGVAMVNVLERLVTSYAHSEVGARPTGQVPGKPLVVPPGGW